MNPERNEQDLLIRLAKNDRKATEILYKENYNMIQSLIINNNGSVHDAKDIFQEAMIVLYENARKEGFELNCQIKTYLYSVCKRLWLKRLQQANRFSNEIDSHFETIHVEEDLEEHDRKNQDFEIMEQAISHLGEPCKSLIEAFYIQRLNMLEIANRFGYTNADNAKNQKYKCLMRLKKLFFTQFKNGK